MAENRLEQLAEDVRRLIAALEDAVRERDALQRQLAEMRAGAPRSPDGSPANPAAAAPDRPAAPSTGREDDDVLMDHVEMLERERSEIRERLTRLLRRLEEVDVDP